MPSSVELFTEEFMRQPPDLPPGEVVAVADSVTLPSHLPAGEYTLAVGIVGEESTEPIVRLAIKGRSADGWYPVSKVNIVRGTDYHVSSTGNDSNPGTAERPWRSIERVNGVRFAPGDTVRFQGGHRFPGAIVLDRIDGLTVTSYGEGPAIIDGVNGTGLKASACNDLTVTNLTFTGSGRKAGNTADGVVVTDSNGLKIDHIEVQGFRGGGLQLDGIHNARISNVHAHDTGFAGISVGWHKRSSRVRIDHCLARTNPGDPSNLTNHSGNGIVVAATDDAVIEYCHAFHNGWDMPRKGNGPVGIWVWDVDRAIIQHCISHDNRSPGDDGGGFDLDGGATNSILQYNLSYNNDGPGYFLCQFPGAGDFKNNIIRYNISHNDGVQNNRRSGIDVFSASPNASDCRVYNNTVFNDHGPAVGFGGLPLPNVTFSNNLFLCSGDVVGGEAQRGRFENNIYWSVDGRGLLFDGHDTLQEWAETTGQEKAGDTIVGKNLDPKVNQLNEVHEVQTLTDPTRLPDLKAYKLQPDSPCLKAGTPIENNGGRDFWAIRSRRMTGPPSALVKNPDSKGNRMKCSVFMTVAACLTTLASTGPARAENKGQVLAPGRPMLIGVDYYPEHWPPERWETDAKLMKEAGFNTVRLAEFAWIDMEPTEGRFEFGWLDDAIEVLAKHDIYVILGTPSAVMPAWVARKYPETLRMKADGTRVVWGGRKHNCYSSGAYRMLSQRIAQAMAEHFAKTPNVIGWQIDNEFGGEACHCASCLAEFPDWLKARYGSLDELNRAWGNHFWGLKFTTWGEITIPDYATDREWVMGNPSACLDWKRFITWQQARFQAEQAKVIQAACPEDFITHNFMGLFSSLDYYDMAADLDFVSWDNYPIWSGKPDIPYDSSLAADVMRGLKQKNFLIMEQTAGPAAGRLRPQSLARRDPQDRLPAARARLRRPDLVPLANLHRRPGAILARPARPRRQATAALSRSRSDGPGIPQIGEPPARHNGRFGRRHRLRLRQPLVPEFPTGLRRQQPASCDQTLLPRPRAGRRECGHREPPGGPVPVQARPRAGPLDPARRDRPQARCLREERRRPPGRLPHRREGRTQPLPRADPAGPVVPCPRHHDRGVHEPRDRLRVRGAGQ
jgi:hypothetical protein